MKQRPSEVREGAAKTRAASTEMLSAAKSLSDQSSRLETRVEKFLVTGAGGVTDRMQAGLRRVAARVG